MMSKIAKSPNVQNVNAARQEMLRSLVHSIDPVAFARSLGIEPDEWQRELLLSQENQIILNCSRQSGKTELTAILALHHALNYAGALVLVLSPSLRQSSELFKKINTHYNGCNRPIPAQVESALTLQLANKSRIVSLPATEKTIRGFSGASLLLIDEAARVTDDLYKAVRPMLAVSAGRIIILSTPNGKRGFFFREWTEGASSWKKIRITAEQCPRISQKFLDEERRALGQRFFEQEYFAQFHESDDSLFSYDLIKSAIKDFDEISFDLGDDLHSSDSDLIDTDHNDNEIHLDLE